MAETVLLSCIAGVLLIGLAAFLLLCFQTTGDFLRDLVSRRTIRTVLRSAKRFRLRTLFGLAAVTQIFVAIVAGRRNAPELCPSAWRRWHASSSCYGWCGLAFSIRWIC